MAAPAAFPQPYFATIFGLTMRISMNVAGAACLLMGGVWFLQGINIIPGSYMTGQTKWAIYGALLLCAGIALLIAANRRRSDVKRD